MNDQEVIRAIIQKDEEVFNHVVTSYSKLLWVVALSVLGKNADGREVEELISDVFFRFWQKPEKYDPEKGSLKNYLALMTKSMALNKVRQKNKEFALEDDFPLADVADFASPEENVWSLFFAAVDTLKDPTREVCLQRFFYERKPEAISQNTGLSKNEVNNRLYKGKQKIRSHMMERMCLKGESQYD